MKKIYKFYYGLTSLFFLAAIGLGIYMISLNHVFEGFVMLACLLVLAYINIELFMADKKKKKVLE